MELRSKSATRTSTSGPATGSGRAKVSREQKLIAKAMAIRDPERESFVEELRRAVQSGTYDPSGEEIAAAIITERENDTFPD